MHGERNLLAKICLLLPCLLMTLLNSLSAQTPAPTPTFTPISSPTTTYTSSTDVLPVTVPDFSFITSVTNGKQTVNFSSPMQALSVPNSWATWNSPPNTETSTPRVLWTGGSTSIILSLAQPATTFGFEAEPDPFEVHTITAVFMSGSTTVGTVSRPIDGFAGALLAAGSASQPITSVQIFSDADFAIAQIRSGNAALTLRSGFGTGPTDAGTEAKDVTQGTPVNASYPLGSQFFIQLAKPGSSPNQPTPVSSRFSLSSAAVAPAISGATLFSSNVLIEFDQNTSKDTKFFRATHLGTVVLTITPDDSSLSPVTVNISVVAPASLGSTHTDIDASLVDLGHRRGIPPHFLKGQIQRESNFNPESYRYEPLSVDFGSVSGGANVRTVNPYALYRLATTDRLAQGANILPEDISPRSIYSIDHNGVISPITAADQFVSAGDIYDVNDATQHWSRFSARTAARVAANPALLDFTAQTPLAASYGYLQILYTTAIAPMRWQGIAGARNPSFLFDTTAHLNSGGGSLDAGSGYLRRIFSRANPQINLQAPDLTAPADFTNAFTGAFNFYNHNSTTGAYGTAVIRNSGSFTPVPASSIFGN